MDDLGILINQTAMGVVPIGEFQAWYNALHADDQRHVMQLIGVYVFQARPTLDHVQRAREGAGLKPTSTPFIMMTKSLTYRTVERFFDLPAAEHRQALLLLVYLLREADIDRRRTYPECRERRCSHEWHADLSDNQALARLIAARPATGPMFRQTPSAPDPTLLTKVQSLRRAFAKFVASRFP